MSIGDWLFSLFDGFGEPGVLLCILALFFIDAVVFPTLPEMFFILGFSKDPTIGFGCELLAAAAIGELAGIFLLYYIVKNIRVPAKIEKVANTYIDFLVVSDERIILVNRIAPMIPFLGAFIALVKTWDPKKCIFYITLGCILKYGAVMLASNFFYAYFGSDQAQTMTLVLIFAIIIISFIASYAKKKRSGLQQ